MGIITDPLKIAKEAEVYGRGDENPEDFELWLNCSSCGCVAEERGDDYQETLKWFAGQIKGWGMLPKKKGYTSRSFLCPDCLKRHSSNAGNNPPIRRPR